MGCITSRGDNWPPKPYKRPVVRDMLVDQIENGEVKRVRIATEDYVWVRPGESHQSTSGGPGPNWSEEASPWQENVIRQLEGG